MMFPVYINKNFSYILMGLKINPSLLESGTLLHTSCVSACLVNMQNNKNKINKLHSWFTLTVWSKIQIVSRARHTGKISLSHTLGGFTVHHTNVDLATILRYFLFEQMRRFNA